MAEISKIQVGQSSYDIVGGLFYGEVDSTSTSTAFTATIPNLKTTALYDGLTVVLKNGVVTSASGFTININGLGAKPVYNSMATGHDTTAPIRDSTIFNINYTMMFIYNSTLVDGGAWICFRGYDGNTNTIGYQLRTNSGNRPMSDTAYRYRLYFTSADGSKWVPANTSTSTDATTSRTFNTRAIDPFGPIVYNSTNGTTNSGARPTVSALWQQYTLTIGYSYVKTLTAWDGVWLKCQPNTNGSAVMKDIVQALPTTKDGFIYIFLGFAYSTTAIELNADHPVYYHDGDGIRIWTGQAGPFATMEDIGGLGGGTITRVKTTAGAHTPIDVTSGPVNFNVPTKTSHLTNDSGYLTSSDIASVMTYKGTKTAVSALPSTGNATGDVWHVTANSGEYAWDGTEWQELGRVIDIPDNTGSSTTGISISDHSTTTITGVQANTTSVIGVQESTTTASKITTTSVSIPNVTSAGSASNWAFENITVPIKATAATSIPNVTAAGSGSFKQGAFTGGSFTQGEDSFAPNVPTKIDTTKFSGGSYSHSGFSGGSYTRGTFNGGSLTMAIDSTDSKKLNITFTPATHGNDSFTPATYGTDTFTAAKLNTGFYTAGTAASFTQGEDEFTPATHAADIHVHTPPTIGTPISIIGVQTGVTTASHVKSGGNGTAPSLGTAITVTAVKSNSDVTVPIKATAATTVPVKNTSTTTVVTGKSHSITDPGHTHTI